MRREVCWGYGLVLAVVAGLSGCCCPMHCSTSCWVEQMQDNYCCMAEQMHDQACCMNQAIANQWHQLTSGSHNDCCDDSCYDDYSPDCPHENCVQQDCDQQNFVQNSASQQNCSNCQQAQTKSAPRLEAPSPIRQTMSAPKDRRCKKCGQVHAKRVNPDRTSGFERAERRSPPPPSRTHLDPTCAAPQLQSGSTPSNPPSPPTFQAAPVPANREPAAAPPAPPGPAPGPTPIRNNPLPGNPPQGAEAPQITPKPAAQPAGQSVVPPPVPPEPAETAEPEKVEMQSGAEPANPAQDGPSLEQTGYQRAAPARKRDGWKPVEGSKPVR